MRAALSLLILLLLAAGAAAQPADASRVLRRFDFDERSSGNVEDVPMNWLKVEGPGLPHYVNGALSREHAYDGRYSFRFALNGGSVIYRYPHGHIRVQRGATYRISVMARAELMPNARAWLTAYFTDIDGHPIKSSITHSKPWAGSSDQQWHKLQIDLEAGGDDAWLVLELGLVQPALWRSTSLGEQALFDQDIDGVAYFDDLRVAQVPRVRLSCDRPGNIFRRSDPLALRVKVEDRITDDLLGQLIVTDGAGRSVYQRSGALPLRKSKKAEEGKTAAIDLPDLPAGWYRATLHMTSGGTDLGEEVLDLIRLPDDHDRLSPDPRFGVVATDLPFNGWQALPQLLPYLGVARVKLAVWNEDGGVDGPHEQAFARLLDNLRDVRIRPTACLVAPPPSIASQIGGSTWAHLLRAPPESWQPQLSYLVSRYAGYLDRWQFGTDEDATRFVNEAAYRSAYAAVLGQFSKLVARPDLAMPWPAWFDLDAKGTSAVALSVPNDVLPEQIPLYLHDVKANDQRLVSLSLHTLPADRYGRDAKHRDLVQRIAYALTAGADRIDLPLPFAVGGPGAEAANQPQETFLILRTILMTLGNATYKGRVPVDDQVEALLFDRDGQGILLLWSRAEAKETRTVQIVLGKQPRRIDLAGNVSAVLQPRNEQGVIDVQVGSEPFFLVGIDGPLAQLRSSFAFDNPLLESSFKPHVRRLRFVNPYPVPISGRVRLLSPAGWNIVTQQQAFSLAPGEAYDAPVTIEFPYNSFAGTKTIDCDLQLQADESHRIKVPVALRLGLGDVGLSTMALRSGSDMIVQQVITNYSDKPIDYTAFVAYPGQPRQERLITALKPGATIIKKYKLTGVNFSPDKKVRSGVRETEGTRVLNDEVAVQ